MKSFSKKQQLNIFQRLRASLRLREAIRKADKAHQLTGSRYYVMPTTGKSGQLIILDRFNFRRLKLKGYINRNTFVKDLENECFYCTPYGNKSKRLSPEVINFKRLRYFSWLTSLKH